MKFPALSIFVLTLFILSACESTTEDSIEQSNIEITAFEEELTQTVMEDNPNNTVTYSSITTGNLSENRISQVETVYFVDNQERTRENYQKFIYDNQFATTEYSNIDRFQNFRYDSQNRVISFADPFDLDLGNSNNDAIYHRFKYFENSIYSEKLFGNLEDESDANIFRRFIAEIDTSGNIIKAGLDDDLDGNMDFENTYEYDSNNNLISYNRHTGESQTFLYQDILDTEEFVKNSILGEQNRKVLAIEIFGFGFVRLFEYVPKTHVKENSNVEYQIDESGYYSSKFEDISTQHQIDRGIRTTITLRYFFN